MPRPKGSKNKTIQDKIDDIIEEVQKLPVDENEKSEVVEGLEDLLDTPKEEPKEEKVLLGYHPITGKEVYK